MNSTKKRAIISVCCYVITWQIVLAASPIDQHATQRTNQLLNLLHTLSRDTHKFLFGQQSATWYGVYGGHAPYKLSSHDGKMEGWTFTHAMAISGHADKLCDVCSVVNDFPAVVGFDLNNLEWNADDTLSYLVKQANSRGAVVTVSWHHRNPVTGGSFYVKNDHGNIEHTVKRLLPGRDHHHTLLDDLDRIASWARSLKDDQGRAIPIIFRPYHEASGGWFWWGLGNNAHNTADDIAKLYQTTVKYLRDQKNVHNFLYAFSPDCGYDWNTNALYPGDDYVDILGVDCYRSGSRGPAAMATAVASVVAHAQRTGKVAAWTEFGLAGGTGWESHKDFFTHDILNTMKHNSTLMGVAYLLTWYNHCSSQGTCTTFAPYPGHPSAADFVTFHNDSRVMFLSDLKRYAPWLAGPE